DVAERCGMTYDGMCQRYKTIVSHLESDTRFMLEYQKTITNQELEIERLELENRNLEYELNRLYKKGLKAGLQFTISQSLIHVPLDAARRLNKPLTDLTLSPYIRKVLEELHIETMEDLLRYMETTGLDSLLDIHGFGILGLEQLKFQLEKHRILDKNSYSDLYQYLVSDPDMDRFDSDAYEHSYQKDEKHFS
ncbi:transcriptional regulator, partial [Parabacteroides segnis]